MVKVMSTKVASKPCLEQSTTASVCSVGLADRATGLATVNPADMAASRPRNCLREEPEWLSGLEPDETESFVLSFEKSMKLRIELPKTLK